MRDGLRRVRCDAALARFGDLGRLRASGYLAPTRTFAAIVPADAIAWARRGGQRAGPWGRLAAAMDPRSTRPAMHAPGYGHAPAASPDRPRLDDRAVEPEGREELLRGRRMVVSPANPEHGDPHFRIDAVVSMQLARDRVGSTDMLSRVADDGDLATDTSVRRAGVNPETGERYLEEMVFEVVNTQRLSDVTAKAEELAGRGVRRIFAVFVRKGVVSEWRDDQWEPLRDDEITDECLAAPIPVAALLRQSEEQLDRVEGLRPDGS